MLASASHINELYSKWYNKCCEILYTSIPNRIVTIRPNDKPWMTSVIRREIRKRNRFLKHYCKYKSPEAWEKYRIQRNFTTSCIQAAKKSYYANLNEKLQNPYTGINKWWGLIKTLYRNKIYSNIPVLLDDKSPVYTTSIFGTARLIFGTQAKKTGTALLRFVV
jgi:hypothetical protein